MPFACQNQVLSYAAINCNKRSPGSMYVSNSILEYICTEARKQLVYSTYIQLRCSTQELVCIEFRSSTEAHTCNVELDNTQDDIDSTALHKVLAHQHILMCYNSMARIEHIYRYSLL